MRRKRIYEFENDYAAMKYYERRILILKLLGKFSKKFKKKYDSYMYWVFLEFNPECR